MSDQKTFLPLGAAAQADNDPHRHDYIRHDQHEPTVNTRMSAADRYALAWTSIAAVFAAFTLLWLIKLIACWSVTAFAPSAGCTLATGLFWFVPIAIASAVVVVPIVAVWRHVRLTQAEMARKAITRDRYSTPISAFAVQQQSIQHNAAFFMAAQQAEITMAPYKMLPAGLDAYSVSNSNAASKTDVPALPDNLDIGSLPSEEWFNATGDAGSCE